MCALKSITVFWTRSRCCCCRSGCEKCIVFFCPRNFWPWFGRTEMRSSVFSCILQRWENSSIKHGLSLPPAGPGTCFQASSFFGICHFVKGLNSVVSCWGYRALAFRVWFGIFSEIGKFPRMGENKVWLRWTLDINRGPCFGMGAGLDRQEAWAAFLPPTLLFGWCTKPKWSVQSFREKHLQTNLQHPAESKGLSSKG